MKQLMGICYKSTFVVLMVAALSNVAMAQFGKGKSQSQGYTGGYPGQGGDGMGTFVPGSSSEMSQPTIAQGNLYEAMKAQNVPSTIRAEDLTADWHVITTETPDYYGYRNSSLYYTTGSVFLFGGQKFLLAYILDASDPSQREAQQYFSMRRENGYLFKGSTLSLVLLPWNGIQRFYEIKKFNRETDYILKPLLKRADSLVNLKRIAMATLMYAQDYGGKLPPMVAARSASEIKSPFNGEVTNATPVQNRLMPYAKSKEIFLQPVTHHPYLPNYKISRLPESKIKSPNTTFFFYEDEPDADGMRCVVYVAGLSRILTEAEFQRERKAQHISESGYPSVVKPAHKAKATPKP
jgi:hypothetical protein